MQRAFTSLIDFVLSAQRRHVIAFLILASAAILFNMESSTFYPYQVVAYGLEATENDAQVVAQVRAWKEDKWGAQVGALKTMCSFTPWRIDRLMSGATRRVVCRMAK